MRVEARHTDVRAPQQLGHHFNPLIGLAQAGAEGMTEGNDSLLRWA